MRLSGYNYNWGSSVYTLPSNVRTYTITVNDVGKALGFEFYNDTSANATLKKARANFGSTASAFKPFQGSAVSIPFGDTIYGAKVDATNGKLVVDRANLTVNTNNMNGDDTYPGWNNVPGVREIVGVGLNNIVAGAITSFTSAPVRVNTNGSTGSSLFFAKSQLGFTANELQAAMPDTNLQFVLPLATPIEIDLDPVTISRIAGQTNNLWADTGDVSVTFAADVKAYIDSKITEAVANALNA